MRKRIGEQKPGTKSAAEHGKVSEIKVPVDEQSNCRWWFWIIMGFLAVGIYSSVPFLIRIFPVRLPFFVDLSHPADLSLNHTINTYITSEEGVTLGVWLTVPDSKWEEAEGKGLVWYEQSLGAGFPIIIYLHGNEGNRGATHRVGIVNVLSAAGFHVVTLDYRGFGDSTGEPTEAGLTTDALALYQWIKARSASSKVFVWGHSLGTGVATNAVIKLQDQGLYFDAIILEAPFTHGRQGTAHYPFDWFYWKFPGFEYFFPNPIAQNNIIFPNDENLKKTETPLLILHAEDDLVVPFHMGQELYHIARNTQNAESYVKMVPFSGSLGYKHNGLYKDPRLPRIIWQFVKSLDQ